MTSGGDADEPRLHGREDWDQPDDQPGRGLDVRLGTVEWITNRRIS